MSSAWPFVGRTAKLSAVRGAIASGGVVLAGPAGVGKSRLAAEAAQEVPKAVRVSATVAASGIPLGAFASLLPSGPPGGNVIRWAADALHRGVLLIVDDAHLLDPVSAALVHHLVVSGEARVLATVRSGERAPDAVTALWKDDLLPRLELEPLDPEEVTELLGLAFGGFIETTTARRLWQISGGNVLFLRELVLSGALTESAGLPGTRGTWRLQGDLPVTTRLRELIESRIGDLLPDEREILELVAHGEPLDAGLLPSADAAQRLEARQLITVGADLSVRLAHPLYGEAIRATTGALRTREIMRRLADSVPATTREELLRVVVWRLDSGATGAPDELIAACRTARLVRDLDLAVRLGRAAVEAGGGVEASLLLANVLNHADRYEETREVLAGIADLPMDDLRRAEYVTTRAVGLYWLEGREEEACTLLKDMVGRVAEPEARQGIQMLHASIASASGRFGEADAILDQIRESGPRTYVNVAVCAVEAGMSAVLGQASAALAHAGRGLGEIESRAEGLPTLAGALLDSATSGALLAGDLGEARRHAEAGYRMGQEYAGWDRAIIPFGARRAEIHRLSGDLTAAIRLSRQIGVRLRGRTVHAGPYLGELAHAYALSGDVSAARATLDLAEELVLRVSLHVEPPLRAAETWILAAQGNIEGAVASALEAADAVEGLPRYELFALFDVVRLGSPSLVVDRLSRLAARSDGLLFRLCARHAEGSPGELEIVSKAFEDLGFLIHAAEASAQAAEGYRDLGRTRAQRAAESRAVGLARRCPGARIPALVSLATPELTPRQREIAQLAASGLSNREIAERLVISTRTVANTLVSAYEKLGVHDRAGLALILNDTI